MFFHPLIPPPPLCCPDLAKYLFVHFWVQHVPAEKVLHSSLYQFARRLRLLIPDLDLPNINAPMVLYRCVRELHLPGVLFGLTMELIRLCQPNFLILEGREFVGPEVNLLALLAISIKLCYGLDEVAEERRCEHFFSTLPQWKDLSKSMSLALDHINKIPWSPEDLRNCSTEKFHEYTNFCRDHAFLAMKSKPVTKSISELFERVAAHMARPAVPSLSRTTSPVKKNLLEAKLPRTIEGERETLLPSISLRNRLKPFALLFVLPTEALPAKNYAVYDVAEVYGRFHSSYQFVLDSLSTYAEVDAAELHKTILKFESKLFEL